MPSSATQIKMAVNPIDRGFPPFYDGGHGKNLVGADVSGRRRDDCVRMRVQGGDYL